MSIGSADLCKAIVTAWALYELDAPFKALWDTSLHNKFPVLNDTEAEASHPFPYCTFTVDKAVVKTRSSAASGGSGTRHIRDVPVEFVVHTKEIGSGSESCKEIAARLFSKIAEVFGGHPTVAARIDGVSLDNGHVLIFQYDTDFGIRSDIENYEWHVVYNARVDVPVA